MEPGFAKRLVGVLRAVYHMLRRGLCRKRLMMDLHLLLGRGKLAGKALRNLVAAAHHHHQQQHTGHMVPTTSSSSGARAGAEGAATSSSSSALAFCNNVNPGDVEFSCTTTPSYEAPAPRALFPFKIRGRGARRGGGLDVAELARAFEMMSAQEAVAGPSGSETPSVAAGATPSPMLALSLGRSPAGARQLRVTDSPFPEEPPEGVDERVDAEASNFIKRFYEQLRMQQAFATPSPDNTALRRRRA